ncbi:MAG: thermonuclease family protein [Lysobacterales bacterium]
MKSPFQSPFHQALRRSKLRRLAFPSFVIAGVAILALVIALDRKPPTPITVALHQMVRVIDGDTIDLDGTRYRLFGIDAPEKGQQCTRNGAAYDCGEAAAEHLRFLIVGERVSCEHRSKDRWGRIVAVCLLGDDDASRMMVRQGWAVAYTEYAIDYVEDERFAMNNGLGMWAKEFQLPKEWRMRRRSGNVRP